MERHLLDDHWETVGDTAVSGDAFLDDRHHSTAEFAARVAEVESASDLTQLLDEANGLFAVVHRIDDTTYLAADHVRSWPVFYATDEEAYVGDTAEWVHEQVAEYGYDPVAATEHLFCCFVTGRETVSRAVNQLLPGEIVAFRDGRVVDRRRYFTHRPSNGSYSPTDAKLSEIFETAIRRLTQYADGRPILLGLSEGFDSRLIALTLHEIGYDNVIAYTTQAASADSDEMETAASIAADLDFDHVQVTSEHDDYRGIEQGEQATLIEASGYLDAYPHINKAVLKRKLTARGIDPGGVVHVLGHTPIGAGSFLPDRYRDARTVTRRDFLDSVHELHYSSWELPDGDEWRELFDGRIIDRSPSNLFSHGMREPAGNAVSGLERYYWQERLPKYIIARREYEVLGFDMWYPLLDRAVFAFLDRTPYQDRIGKRLVKSYTRARDEEIRGAPSDLAPSETDDSRSVIGTLAILVHALPAPVKQAIRRRYHEQRQRQVYDERPRYSIVSQEQFEAMNIPNVETGALYRTLLFLALYDRGCFDLPPGTELDRVFE